LFSFVSWLILFLIQQKNELLRKRKRIDKLIQLRQHTEQKKEGKKERKTK